MLVEFLHDIMKHATSRSVIVFRPLQYQTPGSRWAQCMELIFQETNVTDCSSLACTYIMSVKVCLGKASGLSILLPMTSNGIPVKDGLLRRSWSSPFAMAMFSRSAASTTYLQNQNNLNIQHQKFSFLLIPDLQTKKIMHHFNAASYKIWKYETWGSKPE